MRVDAVFVKDSPNEVVLVVDVHVGCQILTWGERVSLRLLNCQVDQVLGVVIDFFDLLFCRHLVLEDYRFYEVDAIACLPLMLNFLPCSVGDSWIRHGVPVISVGHRLNEDRPVLKHILLGELQRFANCEEVITVDLNSGDDISSLVEVGICRGPLDRGAHAKEVILNKVDRWQAPQLSHIRCLVHLPLVGGTVAKKDQSHVRLFQVLLGKR